MDNEELKLEMLSKISFILLDIKFKSILLYQGRYLLLWQSSKCLVLIETVDNNKLLKSITHIQSYIAK
jgi:hypothetical protein